MHTLSFKIFILIYKQRLNHSCSVNLTIVAFKLITSPSFNLLFLKIEYHFYLIIIAANMFSRPCHFHKHMIDVLVSSSSLPAQFPTICFAKTAFIYFSSSNMNFKRCLGKTNNSICFNIRKPVFNVSFCSNQMLMCLITFNHRRIRSIFITHCKPYSLC